MAGTKLTGYFKKEKLTTAFRTFDKVIFDFDYQKGWNRMDF
jgi:hypothetical protein